MAFAVVGVLAGHALTYALAMPDPLHRDLVLHETGHGYLPLASRVGLVLLVGAVGALLGAALRRGSRPAPTFGGTASALIVTQVAAFVGLEVVERILAGAPVANLASDHLLTTGVAIQALLGVVGAAIVRWLRATSERVAELVGARSAPPRPAAFLPLPLQAVSAPRLAVLTAEPIRGPPPSSSSQPTFI